MNIYDLKMFLKNLSTSAFFAISSTMEFQIIIFSPLTDKTLQQPQPQVTQMSSNSEVNQRSKISRRDTLASKDSESKKREDLTSLGSDDSGECLITALVADFNNNFPINFRDNLWFRSRSTVAK